MINLIEGKISLGDKSISVTSDYEHLSSLAEEGLIEKREDAGGMYYYVESEAAGMRFSFFISLQKRRVEWLLLRWLDSPMKSWDDVSVKR